MAVTLHLSENTSDTTLWVGRQQSLTCQLHMSVSFFSQDGNKEEGEKGHKL